MGESWLKNPGLHIAVKSLCVKILKAPSPETNTDLKMQKPTGLEESITLLYLPYATEPSLWRADAAQ